MPPLTTTLLPLKLPSLHDRTPLSCLVHLPPSSLIRGAAVLAHPYAPLGGCLDDPVIILVKDELLRKGFVVGTFDFRGAGRSGGRTSWTGKPEEGDFMAVAGFLARFVGGVVQLLNGGVMAGDSVRIILGGYSYGSMIASRVQPAHEIVESFVQAGRDTVQRELTIRADQLAAEYLGTQVQMPERGKAATPEAGPDSQYARLPRIQTFYLLISPPLPPVSTALTMRSPRLWTAKAERRNLAEHATLAVFGNKDSFMSSKKFRTWAETLSSLPRSMFRFGEVSGAGHFWREDGVAQELREKIGMWARDVVLGEGA